jgi:hypothetical protein
MDPRWTPRLGAVQKRLKQRQPGTTGPAEFQVSQTESNRRPEDAVAEAQAVTQTPAQPQGQSPEPTPFIPPAIAPDRYHKEALSVLGGYIRVGKDHGAFDPDPVANPGYASAQVSSLNDAYAKALSWLPNLKPGSRIGIFVTSGTWIEDVSVSSSAIDWFGEGRPKVIGHWIFQPGSSDCRMVNFECVSPDNLPAIWLQPQIINYQPYSSSRFDDVWAHGPQLAFWAERRHVLDRCLFWSDTNGGILSETPAYLLRTTVEDNDYSIAFRCHFFSHVEIGPPRSDYPTGLWHSNGFAIKVTSKPYSPPWINTDYGLMRPKSGLRLIDSAVEGSLVCEGAVVQHVGGYQTAGLPSATAAGGTYARIRGFHYDPLILPGIVQWTNTQTHAGHIAEFVTDATLPGFPGTGGGVAVYRGSRHTSGSPPFAAAFVPFGGAVAYVYHDNMSSSASTNWIASGGVAIPDNTTGCGVPAASMFDPYIML